MIFFLQYSTKGCRMVKLKILIRALSRFNNFFDANNRGFLHNRKPFVLYVVFHFIFYQLQFCYVFFFNFPYKIIKVKKKKKNQGHGLPNWWDIK